MNNNFFQQTEFAPRSKTVWRHLNGNIYTVFSVTNNGSDTIISTVDTNGISKDMKLSTWYSKMTLHSSNEKSPE